MPPASITMMNGMLTNIPRTWILSDCTSCAHAEERRLGFGTGRPTAMGGACDSASAGLALVAFSEKLKRKYAKTNIRTAIPLHRIRFKSIKPPNGTAIVFLSATVQYLA